VQKKVSSALVKKVAALNSIAIVTTTINFAVPNVRVRDVKIKNLISKNLDYSLK
jgi:hypothetical protein